MAARARRSCRSASRPRRCAADRSRSPASTVRPGHPRRDWRAACRNPAGRRHRRRARRICAKSTAETSREILAAAERAEHELDCLPPVAEVVRQRLPAGDVALARSLGDRAVGAHAHGQEILQLAFARVAPADAHLLACRRRIDVKPPARRSLGHRIEVGRMDPVGAAIIGHAESARIGDAAAADVVGRFDHHDLPLGGRDPPRRGDAGGARADDDDVRRRGEARAAPSGGPAPQARPRRQETSGGSDRGMAWGCAALVQIARTAGEAQTRRRAFDHLCRFAGVSTSAPSHARRRHQSTEPDVLAAVARRAVEVDRPCAGAHHRRRNRSRPPHRLAGRRRRQIGRDDAGAAGAPAGDGARVAASPSRPGSASSSAASCSCRR